MCDGLETIHTREPKTHSVVKRFLVLLKWHNWPKINLKCLWQKSLSLVEDYGHENWPYFQIVVWIFSTKIEALLAVGICSNLMDRLIWLCSLHSAHCSKPSFFVQKFNFDFPWKLSIKWVKNSWKCCGFGLFKTVDNYDFTRKIVKKNLGEKLVKMLGFCQNWIFGQKFDFLNSVLTSVGVFLGRRQFWFFWVVPLFLNQ